MVEQEQNCIPNKQGLMEVGNAIRKTLIYL